VRENRRQRHQSLHQNEGREAVQLPVSNQSKTCPGNMRDVAKADTNQGDTGKALALCEIRGACETGFVGIRLQLQAAAC
jgi:hypothetical protein